MTVQVKPLNRARQDRDQSVLIDWLGDMALKTGGESFFAVSLGGVSRQRDCRNRAAFVGRQRANFSDERVAVFAGHRNVADQNAGNLVSDHRQRFGGGVGGRDVRAALSEQNFEHVAGIRFVVNDENVSSSRMVGALPAGSG